LKAATLESLGNQNKGFSNALRAMKWRAEYGVKATCLIFEQVYLVNTKLHKSGYYNTVH
jgi:hypothetical protein